MQKVLPSRGHRRACGRACPTLFLFPFYLIHTCDDVFTVPLGPDHTVDVIELLVSLLQYPDVVPSHRFCAHSM